MEKGNIKKLLWVSGRALSLLLFVYLIVMLVVSLVYGLISLSTSYPRLVGTPVAVGLGMAAFLLVLFVVGVRKEAARSRGGDGRATTNHAKSKPE